MQRFASALVLAIVAGALGSWAWWARQGEPRPAGSLDEVVEEWGRSAGVGGVAVAAMEDGELVLERTWGKGNLDGLLTVGSASKWVSAATALTLVDAGLMRLDEPLSRFLPELRGPAATVTLRQALSHTSGIEGRPPCIRDYDAPIRACVRTIADQPLLHAPGAAFRYGSGSYHVVGAAAEVAAGKPWREIFAERIAGPLGWEATRYGRAGLSPNPGIAGNLTTTPREYVRFVQMVLDGGAWNGKQVLSAELVDEMLGGQTGDVPIAGHVPGRLRDVPQPPYGFGVWRDEVDPDGELVVGSADGKFGFVPWLDRERRIAAVFATELRGRHVAAKRPSPSRVMEIVTEAFEADP